jgi:hypothetical protein
MTPDEVRALPATVDVPTAGRCFGLGRDASYQCARDGTFPVPVLRLGHRLLVSRAKLMAVLGIADRPEPAPVKERPRTEAGARQTLDNGAIARALALMILAFRTGLMVSRQELADAVGVEAAVLARLENGETP